MKKFIAYLFLLAFLMHTGSRVIVQMNFFVNQAYIAENLCENRDEPVMECNGSCQLKKELEKDDERKEQSVKHQVEITPIVPQQVEPHFEQQELPILLEEAYFGNIQTKKIDCYSTIFHPPTV